MEPLFEELGERLPVIISGTITDAPGARSRARRWPPSGTPCGMPGRWPSASTARWAASSCGRTSQELAGLADTFVSLYPNAGLPNAFGGYDEEPADDGRQPR